ncbi:phosphodiester glycosidase family protein [Paenibacillus guangzhouensis]|uniref:phosphodiester glycosidase family protein n=1 Tax=Paenibacillus guangzhouensis TaxID=1473112 RepID=UPI001266FA3A|nr:phosphodiester glycosidase family protein [Paenibacillus guangzhouensis]
MTTRFIRTLILTLVLSLTGAMIATAAGQGVTAGNTASSSKSTPKLAYQPKVETKKVAVGGRTYTVQTVTMPKQIGVQVGLAGGKVGQAANMKDIVKRYQADYGINGTYFEAYGGIPEPYGMIIQDGKLAHIGNTGTTIGFTKNGQVRMDHLRVSVTGSVYDPDSGKSGNYYVYFANRTPVKGNSSAILYTPARGKTIGFNYGEMVVVDQGVVTKVTKNQDVDIPAKGYVLVFNGSETGQAKRFKVGTQTAYEVHYKDLKGNAIPWDDVITAVGAGPRLVKDGQLAVNPAAEGFTSAKILTAGGARSGIAVMKDGSIMIATVNGATIQAWAQVMQKLGAQQAMNLDGGASSGLYANGRTLTSAGRPLSNMLLFGTHMQ